MFSINISSVSPSIGCSFAHRVQSLRISLLQRETPRRSQVLPAKLTHCRLLSTQIHASCQCCAPMWPSQPPLGIQQLWHELLHGLQSSSPCAAGGSLLHHEPPRAAGHSSLTMFCTTGCRENSTPASEAPSPPPSLTFVCAELLFTYS